MAETVAADKAKLAIAELLASLGIVRVFCVDDYYSQKWKLDDVLASQGSISPEQLVASLPLIGVVPTDPEVRREEVRKAWERLGLAEQEAAALRIMSLAKVIPASMENDAKAASKLRDVVGEHLTELSPAAWEKEEGEVLKEAAKSCCLLLFDQDLSGADGSATGGMALIKNVLGKDTSGRLICGLLTHTASPNNQHEVWERAAEDAGVERDRFVLVAKGWLSEDPLVFARMLKLVALAPLCKQMKEKAGEILQAVNAEAAQGIENLSVFDFDHIVLRGSYTEGIWEADTLFRLHTIFHRPALRAKAYGNQELKDLIGRMRKVSLIPTDSQGAAVPEQTTWVLQQQEMYETGDHINQLHLPTEVGDIFERTDGQSKKAFILLGQPCDLMVRSQGERAPEISDVLLVEIIPVAEIIPRNPEEVGRPLYTETIEYYGDDRQAKWHVKFRKTHFVDPCVLDMCVFQSDGVSRMDVATACPDGLLPAWTKRFDVLKKRAEVILRRYKTFGENLPKEKVMPEMLRAAKLFPPMIGNSRLFKATVEFEENGGRVFFNCKRIRRLCRPKAVALTLQYASCLTRPAFDRDLGR